MGTVTIPVTIPGEQVAAGAGREPGGTWRRDGL